MLPGVDGFHWTVGHILFLSLFFCVGVTIASTVVFAILRSLRDFRAHRSSQLCWELEFRQLPVAERGCRHEMAGRVDQRTCPNAFDCRKCQEYEKYAALPGHATENTFGLSYPADRLYYRGHTWVHAEGDGTYTIGMDDLAEHLIGWPESVELPAIGSRIDTHGIAFRIRKSGTKAELRSPMDGVVVETGGAEKGWFLRVRPEGTPNLRHLLKGEEVSGWISKELERLQLQLSQPDVAPSLADGGILLSGLMDAMPKADWDNVLAATFLE